MVEKASATNGGAMVLPPPARNRRAATHDGYISRFTPAERSEIAELEDRIRELVPLQTPTVEPLVAVLATQLWRYGRLVEYPSEPGLQSSGYETCVARPGNFEFGFVPSPQMTSDQLW